MERKRVQLLTDIVVQLPKGVDPESPLGQKLLREEFIEFLECAENIKLYFSVDDDPEVD